MITIHGFRFFDVFFVKKNLSAHVVLLVAVFM